MKNFRLMSATAALVAVGGRFTPAELAAGRVMRAPDGHGMSGFRVKDEDGGGSGGGGGGGEQRTPEQIATSLVSQVAEAKGQVEELARQITADVKQAGDTSSAAKEKADAALEKFNGLTAQLTEFGQVIDRLKQAGYGEEETKSLGNLFVESQQFKDLADSADQRGKATLEVKATISSSTANAAGAVGAALQTTRLPGVLLLPQRRLVVRDLISAGQMSGNAIEYVKQTGWTNNAGMVAEAARKPQSDIKLALVNTSAKVIAHFMKASRQILDDLPMLRSLIDNHLTYGLDFREEAQILYGDGQGQNLLGIVPQASDYDGGREAQVLAMRTYEGAVINAVDRIRLAMLQSVLAEFPASGIVLNPIDWALIELLQDAIGRPIIGQPQGDAPLRMWRLPVVDTPAMTAGNFLTGAFRLGAQIFDRWAARIQLATENEDDFVNNLVTILAEERLALAVYRPEAFIYGPLWEAPAAP